MRAPLWIVSATAFAVLIASSGCQRRSEKATSAAAPPAIQQTPAPRSSTAAPQSAAPSASSWSGFKPEAGPVLVGHAVKLSDMTETEQKYGMAPKRGTGVVYQDQVVLMENGDKAVKTWNTNGIELDARRQRLAGQHAAGGTDPVRDEPLRRSRAQAHAHGQRRHRHPRPGAAHRSDQAGQPHV